MGENRNACRVLVGKPEGKRILGRHRLGGRIILKCNLQKYDGVVWTGSIWLRIGPVAGSCEQSNEPSGSIKCWEILE
jgi:hypothetical protein